MSVVLTVIGVIVLILVIMAVFFFFGYIMAEVFFKIDGGKLFDKLTNKISDFIVSLLKGRGK